MRFSLPGNIPVRVSIGFWVTAAIIGFLYSMSLMGTLVWMGVIFISILIHEYGHAITSRYFGQTPYVELIPFGGLTYPQGKRIKGWQEFIVVFNGPLFGFALAIIAYLIFRLPGVSKTIMAYPLVITIYVNVFWTIVNLFPIMPLDGGQLLRIVCESLFGAKGFKYALLASMTLAIGCTLAALIIGYFLIGAIFILFAFQNFNSYRQMKNMTEIDRDEGVQELLKSAENALSENRAEDAEPTLEEVVRVSKRGVLHMIAAQYLAQIKYKKGDKESVYLLLKPLKKDLTLESQVLLHDASFQMKDYRLTLDLAGPTFQQTQDAEVALRSAEAAALLKLVEPTIGWLKAAYEAGFDDIKGYCQRPSFESLNREPKFNEFISSNGC